MDQSEVDHSVRNDYFFLGLDTAAKSRQQQSLQLAPRLRPICAGITFEGRVGFAMEKWKPVIGFEGLYEVSDQGRVRALFDGNHGQYKPGRILKCTPGPKGYSYIGFYRPVHPLHGRGTPHYATMKLLHSVVLAAFRGPRKIGQVCRHLDGVRTNNRLENLVWGTSKENAADAKKHGTFVIGEKNGYAILTENDVRKIRKMRSEGFVYKAIAPRFNTHWSNIWLICKGRTWRHVV